MGLFRLPQTPGVLHYGLRRNSDNRCLRQRARRPAFHQRQLDLEGIRQKSGTSPGTSVCREGQVFLPERVRQRGGTPGCLLHRQSWRNLRHHGAVRQRKVHHGAVPDPPHRANRRRHCDRRRAHHRNVRQGTDGVPPRENRHGVPALWPATAPERAGQRQLGPGGPGREQAGTLRPHQRGLGVGRPGRLGRSLPAPTVRRHAAARGTGPGPGGGHRHPADGRTFQRPGPVDPPADAG